MKNRRASSSNFAREYAPTDEWMTRPQAAQFLGVAPHTLAVWKSSGRYSLPFTKVGRLVRYRKADLQRWLAARTVNGAADAE